MPLFIFKFLPLINSQTQMLTVFSYLVLMCRCTCHVGVPCVRSMCVCFCAYPHSSSPRRLAVPGSLNWSCWKAVGTNVTMQSLFQAYQIMFHFLDACFSSPYLTPFPPTGSTCLWTNAAARYPSHSHFKSGQHSFAAWTVVCCNLCLSKPAWFLSRRPDASYSFILRLKHISGSG